MCTSKQKKDIWGFGHNNESAPYILLDKYTTQEGPKRRLNPRPQQLMLCLHIFFDKLLLTITNKQLQDGKNTKEEELVLKILTQHLKADTASSTSYVTM